MGDRECREESCMKGVEQKGKKGGVGAGRRGFEEGIVGMDEKMRRGVIAGKREEGLDARLDRTRVQWVTRGDWKESEHTERASSMPNMWICSGHCCRACR